MYEYDHHIRVRYGETDQMGYVYYGHYASYYESARVESLRNLGIVYKELEERGIILPVLENHSYFLGPARYDELLRIRVMIPELPNVRIRFEYEILNDLDKVINKGNTLLAFINKETGSPQRPPSDIIEKLAPFYRS